MAFLGSSGVVFFADWATKGAGPSIWSLLRGLGGLGSISKEKLKNHQISDPLSIEGLGNGHALGTFRVRL